MSHPINPKLTAVFIHVTDLRRAADFYSQLVGQSYDAKNDFGNGIYVVRLANGEDLVLDSSRPQQAPAASKDKMYDKMRATCMFGAQDIDAAHSWMQAQGVEIVTEIFRDPNVSFFNFKDPDGNIQMVCQN